jgi:hypothetical protein
VWVFWGRESVRWVVLGLPGLYSSHPYSPSGRGGRSVHSVITVRSIRCLRISGFGKVRIEILKRIIVRRTSSSTITRWQRRNMNGPCGLVVVRRRSCEPHYPTLLRLGGGSHLKGESHPSPNGLLFWRDWAFPWGVCRRTVLSLHQNSGAEAKLRNRCIGLTINPIPPGPDSSNRNRTRIDRLFRFNLFGPPNPPNCPNFHRYPCHLTKHYGRNSNSQLI